MSGSAGASPAMPGPLSLLGHLFQVPQCDPDAVARLMAELGCGPTLALCLAARGLDEPGAARRFLAPPRVGPGPDGLSLPDAPAACERLRAAADRSETVLVWGDYDADGLCSAAVAAEVLGAWGARVRVHIPQRSDGYGLGPDLVQRARDAEASLVLAVDCGTGDLEAVAAARRDGLDVVVADHHLPGARLPDAVAVVNPHRADSRYPFRDLAGVGVTWRLLAAAGRPVPSCLDLVALGTVADVVPLVGENRSLVSAGLEGMRAAPRPGLAALAARAGISVAEVTAVHLARRLAPRLNAAGRVGDPRPALRLLLAADAAEAERQAAVLDEANRARRAMEAEVMEAAEALAASRPADGPVLTCGEDWPLGVLGLVAGRLCQRLGRPVLVGSRQGDRIRGSARSPAGQDITAALGACSSALLRFGGHSQAAGFELDAERLEELRAALRDVLAAAPVSAPRRLLDGRLTGVSPDAWATAGLDPADPGAVAAAVSDLDALEPHGAGNPEPVFLLSGARFGPSRTVGADGQHLKSRLGAVDAVGFGLGHALPLVTAPGAWELAARPMLDRWRGTTRPQWRIEDLRPADGDWGRLHAVLPDRDGLADAYRRLRDLQARGPLPPASQLAQALGPAGRLCLDVLADLRLYVDGRLVTPAARRDLSDSPSFRRSSQVRDTLLRLADAERAAI